MKTVAQRFPDVFYSSRNPNIKLSLEISEDYEDRFLVIDSPDFYDIVNLLPVCSCEDTPIEWLRPCSAPAVPEKSLVIPCKDVVTIVIWPN
jgi:hypothetical protein